MNEKINKKLVARIFAVLMIAAFAHLSACSSNGLEEGYVDDPPVIVLGKAARLVDVSLAELDSEIRKSIREKMERLVENSYSCQIDFNGNADNYYGGDILMDASAPEADGNVMMSDSSRESVPVEFTGTNVQEEGVDEADLVKTDGEFAYVLSQGKLRAFRIWPFEDFSSTAELKIEGEVDSIYLTDDKVVVFSSVDISDEQFSSFGGLKVTIVDVSVPTSLRILRESYYEGKLVNSRRIDNMIHVVINTNFIVPDDVNNQLDESIVTCANGYFNNYSAATTAKEILIKDNKDIISNVSIEKFLPRVFHKNGDVASYPMNISIKRSELSGGQSLVSMISIDLDNLPAEDSVTSIFGSGGIVYGSKKSIYVTQNVNSWGNFKEDLEYDEATLIHRFDITASRNGPDYFGTGTVVGHLMSENYNNAQFALSEYQGFLRVATSIGWDDHNNLYVLDVTDSEMPVVGGIGELAKGEKIYAVRFVGPRGFIVTFKTIDPLFAIDLTDPKNPQVKGELKVPGYSTYLHPYDDGHLIGLGEHVEDLGGFLEPMGVKLSLFNVRDMSNPTERHTEIIGEGAVGTTTEALHNHHAFTFSSEKKMLALPIKFFSKSSNAWGKFEYEGLHLYRVTPEQGFEEIGILKLVTDNEYGFFRDPGVVRRSIIMSEGGKDLILAVMERGLGLYEIGEKMAKLGAVEWEMEENSYSSYNSGILVD